MTKQRGHQMNVIFTLLSSLLITSAAVDDQLWDDFKVKFNKNYDTPEEHLLRHLIFQNNLKTIEAHNKKFEQGLSTYKMGITKFADLSQGEFTSLLNYQKSTNEPKQYFRKSVSDVPDAIDWRTKGAVTNVVNQGPCGGSYILSAIGAMEGAYAIKSGNLVPLSVQELIDCDPNNNGGCTGGTVESAFEFCTTHSVESAADYPADNNVGVCRYDSSKGLFTLSKTVTIKAGDEEGLHQAVGTVGPLSVAINAQSLQFYASGIFDDDQCKNSPVNQAILVVGYGSESGVDFWILKESWGSSFGENGYVRMKRNVDECGIATDAIYPVIA